MSELNHKVLSFFRNLIPSMFVLVSVVLPVLAQETSNRSVSLLVEEGSIMPPQALAKFNNSPNGRFTGQSILDTEIALPGDNSTNAIFKIVGGNAYFRSGDVQDSERVTALSSQAPTPIRDGLLMTPLIVAGNTYGESFITVTVGGRTVVDRLRVATLQTGDLQKLMEFIAEGSDSPIILKGNSYAVVDNAKLRKVTEKSISVAKPLLDKEQASKAVGANLLSTFFAPPPCYTRVPWGPGYINWLINPVGYSIKPESGDSLVWASSPSNAVDAVYHRDWGCGVAYKIPDSCTVSADEAWFYGCCNAAMWYAGYQPAYVNPADHSFPNCPLQ